MKKIYLTMALLTTTLLMNAETFTLTMSDQWGDVADGTALTQWTQQGFTFTPDKGDNSKGTVPAFKIKQQDVRFYALNTLSIEADPSLGNITQIVFTLSKQGREEQTPITCSPGEIEPQQVGGNTITWNGDANKIMFTVGAKNDLHLETIAAGSGQLDFTAVTITVGAPAEKPTDTENTFYMCNAQAENGILSTWAQGNLNFNAVQGDDNTVNLPALKNENEARFYAGNALTISTINHDELTDIEFILSTQGVEQQAAITPSTGSMIQESEKNPRWQGKSSSITFQIGNNEFGTNPAKKGQFDFTQINITYGTTTIAITPEADSQESTYYNLQGMKVEPITPGVYVCVKGDKKVKCIVR